MYQVISVLIILVCILLVLIVLVQNSKGGGLVSNFSSQNQMMGVRQTTDFLEKATWTLVSALLVFCVMASVFIPRAKGEAGSRIGSQVENAIDPSALPGTDFNFEEPPTQE